MNIYLLPFINEQNLLKIIFRQDSARPRISVSTKSWLACKNIEIMFWSSYSPDLNSIENLCGELSRRVYSKGKPYDSVNKFKASISENSHNITSNICKKLIYSMENRIK